jgi:choline dehydrogenase-like flavoprotein
VRAEGAEVILCGGTINSPQLLMLSGIGPADHLRDHGLQVALDLPGVGANLQDHLDICTLHQATQPITYDRLSDVAVAWNYFLHRDGPGTSNVAEAGGFCARARRRHAATCSSTSCPPARRSRPQPPAGLRLYPCLRAAPAQPRLSA